MRIDRLHLLRYGRFTDATIDLPTRNVDLHIILGPNEAGKSTTLSAIESLLFGIPHNSHYGFLHNYNALRIGATLRQGNETLEVWRRKGNKNTLLGPNESSLTGGEAALAPFLGNVDQTFFSRMFCLDHERLRQGGREILDARDELGQILFSAGSGLTGLRDKLAALHRDAEGLWAPRRAAHRKYYQALDRMEHAERAIREHRVTASHWAARKKEYDDVQQDYVALTGMQDALLLEQQKVSRIRRVYRLVRERASIRDHIRSLGQVTPLAPDALNQLEKAERALSDATARIDTLQERLNAAQNERLEVQCDEALLFRETEIREFHQRRIEVRKEQADLVQRRADLDKAQADLKRLAEELGWDASDNDTLVARVPSRITVQKAENLLRVRGEKSSRVENARAALAEAEDRLAKLRGAISSASVVDVSRLAAVVQAARSRGDSAQRIQTLAVEMRDAEAVMHNTLLSLNPPAADLGVLGSTAFPSTESVRHHGEILRDATNKLTACQQQTLEAIHEVDKVQQSIEDLTNAEDVVSSEEIAEARATRDHQWHHIRSQFIEHAQTRVSDADSHAHLAANYEDAVSNADQLADRRLKNAEATAKLELLSRQLQQQRHRVESLRARESELAQAIQAREQEWRQLWSATPIVPLAPELMLEWLSARGIVLQARETQSRADRELSSLRLEEQQWVTAILNELVALGADVEGWTSQPLRVVMERATALQSKYEQQTEHRHRLEDEIRDSAIDVERKRQLLRAAQEVWVSWQTEWAALSQELGLRTHDGTGAVARHIEILNQMRETEANIRQLQHERIGKIERDIDSFTRDASAFLLSMGTDIRDQDPFDAILAIENRLDVAKRAKALQNAKDESIANLLKEIEGRQETARESANVIDHLKHLAGVQSLEALRAAIQQSDQLRVLLASRSHIEETLAKEGDGFSSDELAAECEGVDMDLTLARESALKQEVNGLQSRLMQVVERREQARRDFEAIGSHSQVAEFASEREAAIADMRHTAEQYVRVRTAARLLQWAIDRYRGEKQAPLLTRAGQLFATLTSGSFVNLRVEFADDDRAQLAGVRANDELVPVGGLSDGTADQLYLALRVAAVEDHLAASNALPFVADDLFINFDDQRALAGLQVLSELATRTQVLFFTHHQHLAHIARNLLGSDISIVDLQAASHTLQRAASQ